MFKKNDVCSRVYIYGITKTVLPFLLSLPIPSLSNAEIVVVAIQGGGSTYGTDESNTNKRDNEFDAKQVTVKPFSVSTTEITNHQFSVFVEKTGYVTSAEKQRLSKCWRDYFGNGEGHLPAIMVSWDDAKSYCHWASSQSGKNVRLPSEAEWEFLCRNALASPHATQSETFMDSTRREVASSRGVDGIRGNVAELCEEAYTEPTTERSEDDLRIVKGTKYSPRRGEQAFAFVEECCGHRKRIRQDVPALYVGFRVVFDIEQDNRESVFKSDWTPVHNFLKPPTQKD